MSRPPYIAALVWALVAGCTSAKTSQPTADDARRAVADFYSWYVPLARGTPQADMRAVRERPSTFSPQLVDALRADSVASAASPSEVVGLDGDPFLNSQDPCEQYAPVNSSERDGHFFVDVLGSGGCAAHTTPDVTVDVAPVAGRLVFNNFIFSSKPRADLLATLSDLAAARKPHKN
jgi:hypothetical protein